MPSDIAGVLGRIPVEDTICQRAPHWGAFGFQAGAHILTVCAYVDNFFSAGNTLNDAITILEDLEFYLLRDWGLSINGIIRIGIYIAI